MDFTILWPIDPYVTSVWDADFVPIQTRPLGPRAQLDLVLLDAVTGIDFSYGKENEAYVPDGGYLMLHGDPVMAISVTDADSVVYDQLSTLTASRGWAIFDDGQGTRL